MAFKGVANTNGRPKGSLNKISSEVKATISDIIAENTEELNERLQRLDDDAFVKHYINLLKFLVPMQKAVEVKPVKDAFPHSHVEIEIIGRDGKEKSD
ncbi:hypothetical protein N9Q52_01605 [Polaribacter sp.]|nr:hypothetical protein [Polaribacter sp.]